MGFNTVALILNDAVHQIEQDPDFGKNVGDVVASFSWPPNRRDASIAARSPKSGSCYPALTIVSMAHADTPQVCVVAYNSGHSLWDRDCPEWAIDAAAAALEARGYKVTKRKPKVATV
jgi:hypothetical protein